MGHTNTSPLLATLIITFPSLRVTFVPCRSLQPRFPCFTVFYTLSYNMSLGVYRLEGTCVSHKHFSLFFDCGQAAPLQDNLVPCHTHQLCYPCFTGFYAASHSVFLRVHRLVHRLFIQTLLPPFTTLVKLFPMQGNLVPCRTLQLHCPCWQCFTC